MTRITADNQRIVFESEEMSKIVVENPQAIHYEFPDGGVYDKVTFFRYGETSWFLSDYTSHMELEGEFLTEENAAEKLSGFFAKLDAVSCCGGEDGEGKYLPLTGGTLTGDLYVTGDITSDSSILPTVTGKTLGSVTHRWAVIADRVNVAQYIVPSGNNTANLGALNQSFNQAYISNLILSGVDKTHQINALDISGDGTKFLANDGTYKSVLGDGTAFQVKYAQNDGSGVVDPLSVLIPENSEILSVNYNRLKLFSSDYSYTGGVVTVTNPDIVFGFDSEDRIEVAYV